MLKKLLFVLIFFPLPLMAKETLTVYAASSFTSEWGAGPLIKQAFEAKCQCELKLIGLSDSATILNRLRLEGRNTPADVVLSLDNNLMSIAEKTALFQPQQFDTSKLTLPIDWQNDYFIPYDYGYFAFIYNKTRLSNPPRSMVELLDPKNHWRIIYQDPRTSTTGFGLLTWLEKLYGVHTEQAWQQLSRKTITVTKGWSESYGLFLKGEADFVLSYSTSPAYHIIDEHDDRYAAAIFSEGHYLQIELAGQLRHSQHPELAQQFMQFILSPDFQRYIATKNWMYPVIDVELPETFTILTKPRQALILDPKLIEQSRATWIREWQNAVIK